MSASQVARVRCIPLNDGPLAIILQDLFKLSLEEYKFLLDCVSNGIDRFGISTAHVCTGQRQYLYTLGSKDVIEENQDGRWTLTVWGRYILPMVPVAMKNSRGMRRRGVNLLRFPPQREIPLDTIR